MPAAGERTLVSVDLVKHNVKWTLFFKGLIWVYDLDINASVGSTGQQGGLQMLLSLNTSAVQDITFKVRQGPVKLAGWGLTLLGSSAMPTFSFCVSFELPDSISLRKFPVTRSVPARFVQAH